MEPNESNEPKAPRLSAKKKSEIANGVATRLLADKKFLETTADRLLASKPFTRRIILALLLVGVITAAIYAGLGFWALDTAITKTNNYLTNQFATYVRTNDLEISNKLFAARQEVTNRIRKEFETERIQSVVTAVASNRASELLMEQIRPEIASFRATITNEIAMTQGTIQKLKANAEWSCPDLVDRSWVNV